MKLLKRCLYTLCGIFLMLGTISPVSAQENVGVVPTDAASFTCGLSYLVSNTGWKYGFNATMIENGTSGASKQIYGTYTLTNTNNGAQYSYNFDSGIKIGAINYTNTNNRGYTFTRVFANYWASGIYTTRLI